MNLYDSLVVAEALLDEQNAAKGNTSEYCIQCKSTTYDALVGIRHKETCIIQVIREYFSRQASQPTDGGGSQG